MAVLWTAIIVYALVSPPSGAPRFPWLHAPGMDKLIHTILFSVEAALLHLAVRPKKNLSVAIVLVWCAFLGGGLEVVQHQFVEGRTGDWFDFLADMFGGVCGVAVALKMEK